MAIQPKAKVEVHTLPESRVINCSFWKKDIYVDPKTKKEGKALYKGEFAFNPDDVTGQDNPVENAILNAIEAEWGSAAVDDYLDFLEGKSTKHRWASPFLDGNKLAADRAARGKEGDAYKGKLVMRANSAFNAAGADAPGGIAVFGPDMHKIGEMEGNTAEIFVGCYGRPAITLKAYEINGNRYVATYLSAFQKTRGTDADRLSTAGDKSTLFTPVGGAAANDGASGRRRRAG